MSSRNPGVKFMVRFVALARDHLAEPFSSAIAAVPITGDMQETEIRVSLLRR
jgi:hypothetical protein